MADLSVTDLRPFVPSKDFAVTKRFYAALGWPVRDVGPGLALVDLGDRHCYLQDFHTEDLALNFMLHLTVADAQAWHDHVAAVLAAGDFAGARVQQPQRQSYGAQVTFVHDPSGVLLHLCQWD